jgi:hypothetical protein
MFLFEPAKVDPQAVEEFQLPGIEDQKESSAPGNVEFQPWDYGDPGGGPLRGQALADRAE